MQKFKLNCQAEIEHINVRKEGDDEKELAVDLKLSAVTIHDVLFMLDDAIDVFFFKSGGIVRNTALKPVGFDYELQHYALDMLGISYTGCVVKKIEVKPIDGSMIALRFQVSLKPLNSDVSRMVEFIKELVEIKLYPQDGELEFS